MIKNRWLHQTKNLYNNDENYYKLKGLQAKSDINFNNIFKYRYIVPETFKSIYYRKKLGLNIYLIIIKIFSYNILLDLYKSSAKIILFLVSFYLDYSITFSICNSLLKKTIDENINLESIKPISLPLENKFSSYFDAKLKYKNWIDIVKEILMILWKEIPIEMNMYNHHDISRKWVKGHF